MDIFKILAALIIATFVSSLIYQKLAHKIPLAFIQIGAGLLVSLASFTPDMELEPELFMLLVIAPLLFNEGQNMDLPKSSREFKEFFRSTFALAFVLASLTVLIIGFLAGSVLKDYPLPVRIALAAIVTPTDATALISLTAGKILPEKIKKLLENESLFNDATGLVLFSLALTTYQTGQFHLMAGILEFLKVSFGGLLVGILLGWFCVRFRQGLKNAYFDENAVLVPYHLMIPFAVYVIAEYFQVSGILAVVATGIVHAYEKQLLQLNSSKLQVVTTSIWEIISNLLNGIVFVLLGTSLPNVWREMQMTHVNILRLVMIAIAIYALITLIRFVWLYLDMSGLSLSSSVKSKNSAIFALSGMHGTITLSMAFSLPFTLGMVAFPHREELIFISSVVIMTSLLVPTVMFHFLLPKMSLPFTPQDITKERDRMVDYAIQHIAELPGSPEQHHQLILLLRSQKDFLTERGNPNVYHEEFYQLLMKTQKEEYEAVQNYVEEKGLHPELLKMYRLIQKRVLSRVASQRSFYKRLRDFIFVRKKKKDFHKHKRGQVSMRELEQKIRQKRAGNEWKQEWLEIENVGCERVRDYLVEVEQANPEKLILVDHIMKIYERRHALWQDDRYPAESEEIDNKLLIQAFQYEYTYVQEALAAGKISEELARELYSTISNAELIQLQATE